MTRFLMTQREGGNHDLALADGGNLPVQIGEGPGGTAVAFAFTNGESQDFSPVSPDAEGTGTLLAVLDITPQLTGNVLINFRAEIGCGASPGNDDLPELLLFVVQNLTAITGGTAVAAAFPAGKVIALPTSTTPAPAGGDLALAVGQGPTVVISGQATAHISGTAAVRIPVGTRAGIVLTGISPNARTWTWGLSINAFEQG